MSSVIVISSYFFPLWIWNLRPTKFGKMVAERACVLIGACFSPTFARAMGRLEVLSRDVREEAEGPYGRMLGPSNVVSYTDSTRQRFDLPFQTDRAQSARVGNIMMCYVDVKSEVALSSRPLRHVITWGH